MNARLYGCHNKKVNCVDLTDSYDWYCFYYDGMDHLREKAFHLCEGCLHVSVQCSLIERFLLIDYERVPNHKLLGTSITTSTQ